MFFLLLFFFSFCFFFFLFLLLIRHHLLGLSCPFIYFSSSCSSSSPFSSPRVVPFPILFFLWRQGLKELNNSLFSSKTTVMANANRAPSYVSHDEFTRFQHFSLALGNRNGHDWTDRFAPTFQHSGVSGVVVACSAVSVFDRSLPYVCMSVCVSELIRFAGCLFAWAEPDGVYVFIQDRLDFFANSQFHLAGADYGNNFSVVCPALIFVALSIDFNMFTCLSNTK